MKQFNKDANEKSISVKQIDNGYIVKYMDTCYRTTEYFCKNFDELVDFIADYYYLKGINEKVVANDYRYLESLVNSNYELALKVDGLENEKK